MLSPLLKAFVFHSTFATEIKTPLIYFPNGRPLFALIRKDLQSDTIVCCRAPDAVNNLLNNAVSDIFGSGRQIKLLVL